jgi:hypothetical protein
MNPDDCTMMQMRSGDCEKTKKLVVLTTQLCHDDIVQTNDI